MYPVFSGSKAKPALGPGDRKGGGVRTSLCHLADPGRGGASGSASLWHTAVPAAASASKAHRFRVPSAVC